MESNYNNTFDYINVIPDNKKVDISETDISYDDYIKISNNQKKEEESDGISDDTLVDIFGENSNEY